MKTLAILAFSAPLAAAALIAAAPQSRIAQVPGGLWEMRGAPAGAPVRLCVADVLKLAQFEHRERNCSRSLGIGKRGSTIVTYECGPGDFGRSEIDVITPRSLKISTQGISDQMPFNYVLQARRISDCSSEAPKPRH